jgi:tetratricopeptide (TPR) repeat protein
MLRELLPLVPRFPHRRIVLVKLAGLANDEQLHDECLAFLDEADELADGTGEKDFAATMLRASAMLEIEDYDGADELLSQAITWNVADEDKAQCLFVTACLRLKQGRLGGAREILQKLAELYPCSTVAAKARHIAVSIK